MKKTFRTLVRIAASYTILSLAGVFVSGSVSPVLLLPVSMTIVFRLFFPQRKVTFAKNSSFQDAISASILLLYMILRIILTGGDILVSFLESLLLFQGLKWISPLAVKDFFVLTGIAYIEVVASASLTSKILFLPIFTLTTVLTTIMLFILFVNTESSENRAGREIEITLKPKFISLLGGVGLISMLITIVIFLSIPRLGVGFFSRKMMNRHNIPGASGKIDLKNNTFSNFDGRVIARIKGDIDDAFPLYLKSITLSAYRSDTWYKRSQKLHLTGSGTQYLYGVRKNKGRTKGVEVFLEPTGDSQVPTLPKTKAITWDFGKLFVDQEGDVNSGVPINFPVRYVLHIGQSEREDGAGKTQYLERGDLPEKAVTIAETLEAGREKENDKVSAITHFLRKNFRYNRTPGRISLMDFLSGEKEGNCQHFATATVLFARAMGLPARVAGGYISSEFNEIGKYWMVRQKDAHAWAEVFLQETGWTIVDSTPPGLAQFTTSNRLNHILDWIRQNWQEYVVGYNIEKQVKLSKGLIQGSLKLSRDMSGSLQGRLKALLLSLLALFVTAACLKLLPSQRNRIPVKDRMHPVYRQFLKPIIREGRKHGIQREKTETPTEYLEKVNDRIALESNTFGLFLDMYNRARFGEISPGGLTDLLELTVKIRRAMKK